MEPIPVRYLTKARKLIREINAAVMTGDHDAYEKADLAYEELPAILNGGKRFGCAPMNDALAEACAAPIGEIPLWGQRGHFYLCVAGMPVLVEYSSDFSHQLEFRAILKDTLFISETGYRCMYLTSPAKRHAGRTVAQAAEAEIRRLQGEKKGLVLPDWSKHEPDFLSEPFVLSALEHYLATLPTAGAHVEINALGAPSTIGVVLGVHPQPLPDAPVIEVAYFAHVRKRQVPRAITRDQLVANEVRLLTAAELEATDSLGKHLTIGIVEALEAITDPEVADYNPKTKVQ